MNTVSDIITRLRNAIKSKHTTVKIINTKVTIAIASILKEEGFIDNYINLKENNNNFLLLVLKYQKTKLRNSVIHKIKNISKPGSRVYIHYKKLPKILNNLGIAILSTSNGIITNLKAKKLQIGGEILCYIW
uniref:30S ribosomal protein S8 n=1 Tax=Nitzschia alba TaxID=2858 RepID=A0A5C0F4T7_NITAL|nr:30S ribosomal protein S8 [Nitzschia alba]QEI59567.1 30S ribosomal protein S8 [Nitzschia alba]